LDHQPIHLLRRVHQRATALLADQIAEHDLTPGQFYALSRLDEHGTVSQNHLGRLAAMDPATIQGVIRRLSDRGYVHRLPDPSDRRRMLLRMTPEAQQIVRHIHDAAQRAQDAFLDPLDNRERQKLQALLRKLL
jgi:DNA-binding MarR family transcriptional regulator